jgi:uncharacterized protein (DUF1684 family)
MPHCHHVGPTCPAGTVLLALYCGRWQGATTVVFSSPLDRLLHVLQAWLDPLHLPTAEQLTCATTGRLMRFLLQVYCPVDSNPVEAFHRMVFLFVSPRVRVRVRGRWSGQPCASFCAVLLSRP